MRVLIDGDGCPVVNDALALCRRFGVPCLIFCDTAHELQREDAETVVVSKGADSADFALVNRVEPGDVVVTQDYGLAAMCLSRQAAVLNQDGRRYTEENIDGLLYTRYLGGKVRRGGGRLKGPPKRKPSQTEAFRIALHQLLEECR
ncbi:MAG: DUF188 domain-containing protein [Clostridiales bacterium]|nr:DUF188 domain-containing protein [Clostridiales bacterium]